MAAPDVIKAFEKLGQDYEWADEIVVWMTAADGLGAKKISDFVHVLADASGAEAFIRQVKGQDAWSDPKRMLMASRVRQAWVALQQKEKDDQKLKSQGLEDSDLDRLLPQPTLDSYADVFYARYRVTLMPWQSPSDQVISRLARELEKKQLTMREVFKVKSQAQQMKAQKKSTPVGGGMSFTYEQPDEHQREEAMNLRLYLDKLYTLMVAYAVVGARATASPPASETRGCDTTLHVEIPWDVCLKYHAKVLRFSSQVPYSIALDLVRKRDEGDRELWLEYYRNGTHTLGQVIQRTTEVRDAVWQVPEEFKVQRKTKPEREDRRKMRSRTPPTKPKQEQQTPQKVKAKDLESKMKNGEPLCRNFQFGSCKNSQPCVNGRHQCAVSRGGGRVCGGTHPAYKCNLLSKPANKR